ncbi:hypothetical protein JQ633_27685 [Bradyrhizobium tropiciagri]|uniref:hypothetical protein n=1 Tax=Bradyrhizobium tropiciagri TaxID=312253 RepID=UPI001BA6BD4D|nr:hypothetical protein [Bradyrhizobium tropiciagri]MBR0874171.1 hypothetical protein [Bradyrhizobium tropiciagri]
MTAADLKDLLERAQSWPKAAQDELLSMARKIEDELRLNRHVASTDELQITEAAIASIDVAPDPGRGKDHMDIEESMKRLVAANAKSAGRSD